ncbi:MAG: hypothetical protein QM640_04750 [Niabella sp.]
MNKLFKPLFTLALITGICHTGNAQAPPPKPSLALWDGMVVAGYVNEGAYVNFGGPAIKFAQKPFAVTIGMLPSLRIKEDNVSAGAKKNSTVTPSLGAGVTVWCKHIALQVPVYYNAKTSTDDGKWNVGVGIGYKF